MIKGGLQKRGKVYYAVYRQNGKQVWKSTNCTKKDDALTFLQDTIAPLNASDQARALREASDIAYERKGQVAGRSLRLSEVWDKFVKSPERLDAAESTMGMYKGQVDKFLRWMEKERPKMKAMADVTDQVARDYAEYLTTETGSPTYNKHRNLLIMVWKIVGRSTGWKENPWIALAKKRTVSVSRRDLTVDEIKKLIEVAEGEWKNLVRIGLYTALRLADAATLKWNEVDLAQGRIVREPRKTVRRTGKSVSIPIFNDLYRILEALKDESPEKQEYVLPTIAALYNHDATAVSKRVSKLFDLAQIVRMSKDTKPGRLHQSVEAGFHSLRHSFVSLCSTANVPLAVVQSIVGHGNPAMTRHYTHIGEDAARSAVASLPTMNSAQEQEQQRQSLPEWAIEDLKAMTAKTWKGVRDSMLATPCTPGKNPATATAAEPDPVPQARYLPQGPAASQQWGRR